MTDEIENQSESTAAESSNEEVESATQTEPTDSPETAEEVSDHNSDGEGAPEEEVIEALRQVIDPELMVNIVDLGLIYEIDIDGPRVEVEMTLTSPACPAGPQIMQQAKMSLERHAMVDEAHLKLVMSPPWTPDRMSDDAKDQLGIF